MFLDFDKKEVTKFGLRAKAGNVKLSFSMGLGS